MYLSGVVTRCGAIAVLVLSIAAIGVTAQENGKWERLTLDSYELYAPTKADIELARPELEFAATQFRKYFGVTAPQIAVVLSNDQRGALPVVGDVAAKGLPVLNWLTDAAWAGQHGGASTHSESHILPHEACHLFLVTYVNERITRERAGAKAPSHYGHPQIPDWFDEGVASLCERPDMQARRRAKLKERLTNRIPLDELFTMAHPLAAGIPVRSMPGGVPNTMKPGTRVGAVTFSGSQLPQEMVARTVTFYAQVFSVIDYLSRTAAPESMRVLADRMAAGATTRQALGDLKGLPSADALESAWLATIEK
jgi:hypothetical protein